jgi:hypothetical protein
MSYVVVAASFLLDRVIVGVISFTLPVLYFRRSFRFIRQTLFEIQDVRN